jgi:hypothetical protein
VLGTLNLLDKHYTRVFFLCVITGDESPACLDGSQYGFYFRPSQTGSTKWYDQEKFPKDLSLTRPEIAPLVILSFPTLVRRDRFVTP